MKWSFKIGQFAGIGVYVHVTFFLIFLFIGWQHYRIGSDPATMLMGMVFVLSLFLCVVLHEFGHALTAKRYGIKTKDITLLPIGGLARLEKMPEDPRQELWVALAGPAVNVVIAALLAAFLFLSGTYTPLSEIQQHPFRGAFLERLLYVNLFLVAFNMLPAFPMDGGRVLRALLATRMDYVRATKLAARAGQFMAIFFTFAGLFLIQNPFLVFIALFVWIGAEQEAMMVQMKFSLGGIPVSGAMITEFRTVKPSDSLAWVAELILSGSQQDFPVTDGEGRVIGMLSRNDLIGALTKAGAEGRVGDHMKLESPTVDHAEMLETVVTKLQDRQFPTIPVLRQGRLVGLLTTENVGELLMIQGALRQAPRNAMHFSGGGE